MSKLVFIYITLLLPSLLFAGNKRVITWDKLGQTEIIKKGEDFEFLYRNANPENTRILLKPSNKSDEFILELNRYNIVDKALENKKSDQAENDSLVRILQKENSNLVFRVKNNKIYLEEENKISQKLNKTIEKISTPLSKNNSTINKEDIAVQANKDIISIQKDISSNLSEMERNRIVIEKIKGKINGLGNSKADNLLGQQFHLLVDSLEQKNSYLARSNQLLVIDKNLLLKDKEIIELQIAKEINFRNLSIFIALVFAVFFSYYYKNYKIKKKSETLLSEQNEIITIEREKSDKLLLNILPHSIAKRLKNGETFIADKINEATIIFVDIEKFTQLSQDASPDRIVIVLNDIYSKFDQISEKYGIEKIKTIGDCYMAASGVPEQRKDHAIAAANWAIDIGKIINNYVTEDGTKIDFRVGLDAGPVVAGVIGEKKFIYDLWGDTVNTASRMETNGMSGMIHVTDKFKKIIENDKSINNFKFETRGELDIKGKGKLKTWFMTNNI